jgi:hypothetical protein
MSPTEINKRIAIFCGWTWDDDNLFWVSPDRSYGIAEPPNYNGDLNAMHEAEKTLDHGENHQMIGGFGLYLINLPRVCDGKPRVCATAAQRAEAFLRTIGQDEITLQLQDKEGGE